MKQRIEVGSTASALRGAGPLALLLVLAWSAVAFAQTPATPAPDEPAEGPLDEGPLDEPAEPEQPSTPAAEPDANAAGQGEAGGEAGVQVGGEAGVQAGTEAGGVEAGGEAAAAAEAPPAEEPPAAGGGDEIVVTGSRIKRATSFASSAPVDVIDRKQLELTGATNAADVVQNMAATGANGFRGQGAGAGAVGINLRGLGFQATLVLVNGRRMTPAGAGVTYGFSDLATIPLSAIERIEVLKGGGSAIYGSDAVAGVVNVITRKNFDGVRVEADGQTTEEFDQKEGTISVAFGANSERGRVMTAVSYFRSDELTAIERDFTKGKYVSTQGNPATFLLGTMTIPDPACGTARHSLITTGATGGQICGFDYREYTSLLGAAERAVAFSSAEYDITNHTTLFGELNVSRLRSYGTFSPSFALPPPFPTIPADHVDNPFGVPVGYIGRPLGPDYGGARNTADDDTLRAVVGIKGDLEGAAAETLFESWEWELYTSFGVSRYRNVIHDNLRQEFQDALNSCSDPADLSKCFNPFSSSKDGTGTPNSDAVIENFSGEEENLTDHALQTYNAGMTGTLFELPGGDVGLAFGGEARHEWRSTEIDHAGNLNQYGFVLGNSDAKASRNVYSGYLELRWPFYDGIELQTAGRVEHYTSIGKTAVSPSAGLTVSPADIAGRDNFPAALHRWTIRGQVTQAFRAPTLYQEFPGRATAPVALIVPPSPLPIYTPVVTAGNPDLDPERALVFSVGTGWQPVDEITLLAEYWNYNYEDRIIAESGQGITNQWIANNRMDPRVIIDPATGGIIRVEARQLNADGSVKTSGLDFGLTFTLTGATFGGGKDDWGAFSFGGMGTYTMSYTIPRKEAGTPIVNGMAMAPHDCDGTGPTASCEIAGKRNATTIGSGGAATGGGAIPQLRVNFPVSWVYAGHMASVNTHFMSGLEDDIIEPGGDNNYDPIDPMITVDLQYGYTLSDVVGKELTFRLGVYNLLDQDPPSVNGLTTAFEPIHDPRGRMFYAKLISQF